MALIGSTRVINRRGFESALSGASGIDYRLEFGGNMNAIFKPFSTNFDPITSGYQSATGVITFPHYQSAVTNNRTEWLEASTKAYHSITTPHPQSGLGGLNSYGRNTWYQGLICGTGMPTGNLSTFVDARDVRSFGIKTPFTYVGYGFDIFGYPAPNNYQNWTSSGIYATGRPEAKFLMSSGAATGLWLMGSEVAPTDRLAAPLDLRYDNHRKVWTMGNIWAGQIRMTYINGVAYNSTAEIPPYYANEVTYDAQIYDGVANGLYVTGVIVCSPRTSSGSLYRNYKILPQVSGESCIIMVCRDPRATGVTFPGIGALPGYDRPTLGVWVTELIAASSC